MGNKLYLIKEGEISLKGGNRNLFEKQLRHNIKNKLRPYHSDITKQKGRLYAEISDEAPDELVEKALSTTSGITAFARAYMTEKNIESIVAKALEILPSSDFKNGESFRVTVKREDKTFPMNSHETSCALADAVFSLFPEMTVDLKHPEHTLTCEIRNDVYLYTSEKKGESGLPYATAGKGMLLLSADLPPFITYSLFLTHSLTPDTNQTTSAPPPRSLSCASSQASAASTHRSACAWCHRACPH